MALFGKDKSWGLYKYPKEFISMAKKKGINSTTQHHTAPYNSRHYNRPSPPQLLHNYTMKLTTFIISFVALAMGAEASCFTECKSHCDPDPRYCNSECVGRCMAWRCPEYVFQSYCRRNELYLLIWIDNQRGGAPERKRSKKIRPYYV